MKVLFVEDEVSKQKQIIEHLYGAFKNYEVLVEKSLMSGINRIHKERFDLVLLDMSLPLYDLCEEVYEINEFEAFAGIDLLEELTRIQFDGKVLVITAFDVIEDSEKKLNLQQLDEQMKKEYSNIYIGCIHYNSSSLEWKKELDKILAGL